MSQQVLTITQINEYIRNLMDRDVSLSAVAVRGEISNYKVYPSGHHYFTLKDDGAALKCVMFRGSAARLRFRPENGMQVLAMGNISVYPRDGAYQLYCAALIPDGVGDLYTAFEQLKNRLAEAGLFDSAHKLKLPKFPRTIGIVTSQAGAAIHDMIRVLRKRYPLCKVVLLPVRVQGAEAPEEIAEAIAYANRYQLADLLIVGRGGGSIEDLWAFNDERVAYAIYESEIPVISAVGHEPDVTISDFVADLRAATPSNAAELAVPDRDALRQNLDSMSSAMASALSQQLKIYRRQMNMLAESSVLKSSYILLDQKKMQVEAILGRIIAGQKQLVNTHRQRYLSASAKLDALSPLKVLVRGYAVLESGNNTAIHAVNELAVGDEVCIHMQDGTAKANIIQVKENTI